MKFLFRQGIHKGFTIIELLLVVAIIGILASAVFAMFNKPKEDSRDARRESDMKQLQNALALYMTENGAYPICTTPVTLGDPSDTCFGPALVGARAIVQIPTDPLGVGACPSIPPAAPGGGYCYQSNSIGNDYAIYYHPESGGHVSGKSVGAGGWYVINP